MFIMLFTFINIYIYIYIYINTSNTSTSNTIKQHHIPQLFRLFRPETCRPSQTIVYYLGLFMAHSLVQHILRLPHGCTQLWPQTFEDCCGQSRIFSCPTSIGELPSRSCTRNTHTCDLWSSTLCLAKAAVL